MKTLGELREAHLAETAEREPGVAALLIAWTRHDEAAAPWLAGLGVQVEAFVGALRACPSAPLALERAVLVAASMVAGAAAATPVDLLRALSEEREHPAQRALTAVGLPWRRIVATPPANPMAELLALGVTLAPTPAGWQRYGRDLSAEAARGAFAGLLPRSDEHARLIDCLLKREKGNAVLTGPAGVGKTALVEALAAAALADDHPLHGWRFVELAMGKLVAGTQYRGQFEARVEEVLQELEALWPAVLFIDEVHLLVGAGRAEGVMTDGGNLLKPYLARGSLRVIGATTTEEYHRHIARDKALARRCQEVALRAPDAVLARQMLDRQAVALAVHHGLDIPGRILDRAIALTERHLPQRHLPDKAVDLLDTTAAAVRRQGRREIHDDDLLETLARLTGMPLGRLDEDARLYLAGVADRIKARLKGQDAVVDRVVATLLERRLGLEERRRPLAVLLFSGATGVGKTELARLLASEFFGDPGRLVHLDMAEYGGPGAVHKLIGAPAGYLGADQEGVLIQALQGGAQGVVLFDEIEKASPEVHRLLLGLCDEGRVRSARGELSDARGWILVLTSNALSGADLARLPAGFTGAAVTDPRERLAEHFPAELLGRMDEVLVFRSLDEALLREILAAQLEGTLARLAARGVRIEADSAALLGHLAGRIEPRSGARGIARALERGLLQPLAQALLLADPGQPLRVVLDEGFYREGRVGLDGSGAGGPPAGRGVAA